MKRNDKKIYIKILDKIVKSMVDFIGSRIALTATRKAPVKIDLEGNVVDYWGEGEVVVDILLKQYEIIMGDACHPPIKKAIKPIIEKTPVKLPERIAK
jgi:hypothetical protein